MADVTQLTDGHGDGHTAAATVAMTSAAGQVDTSSTAAPTTPPASPPPAAATAADAASSSSSTTPSALAPAASAAGDSHYAPLQQQQQQGQSEVSSEHMSHEHVSPYVLDPDVLRNLIVNYLPPLMDERQVHHLFGQFGPIDSVKIIYDKATRESRGYGFVKYAHFFSATYAIACLNRFQIAGKKLKVAYANIDGAKEAYEQVRHTASAFTPQQQLAYSIMYQGQTTYNPE